MGKAIDDLQRSPSDQPPPAEASDEELFARYRERGDRDAFAALVHRYERELYNYLRRYLNDATLAEDAFQTTFLQVHLKCDQFEPGRRFRPWLYMIATNQAIDALRRNKRHRGLSLDRTSTASDRELGALVDLLVSREPDPDSRLSSDQARAWIEKALESLPDSLRQAVDLVYYRGMKYREAAEVLGIPVGTVKSRLHTAILKLNEAWFAEEQNAPRGAK